MDSLLTEPTKYASRSIDSIVLSSIPILLTIVRLVKLISTQLNPETVSLSKTQLTTVFTTHLITNANSVSQDMYYLLTSSNVTKEELSMNTMMQTVKTQ